MNGSEQVWRNPDASFSEWTGRCGPERRGVICGAFRPTALCRNQDSFFRFSEIAFIATDKPIQFCGTLDELSTFLANGKYQFTPEYWWPADHSCCVCSDYDLTFTIVAGSKELVSGVLNDATLEAMQVTPETRIDSYAPMPK
jgi:hypothetical protein